MFRLVATAVLGYVAYRIAKEISVVSDDFGSHLPQQHRRSRPKPAAKPAPKRQRRTAAKTADATSAGAA